MTSYLPFVHVASSYRAKRKMSAPVVNLTMNSSDKQFDVVDMTSTLSSANGANTGLNKTSNGANASTMSCWSYWMMQIVDSIDVREAIAFFFWELSVVSILCLVVTVWCTFFKFVVEPEEHHVRAKWGGLWVLFTGCVFSFRHWIRTRCDDDIRRVADHAEIFVTTSLAMVCSANVAFYLHVPSSIPLRDLGFMLIPAQADNSPWRPLSDILTVAPPIFFMFQSYLLKRSERCYKMATFFRCITICYGLRMFTISMTSLPGPAPHCRPGSADYMPPQSWTDIVTRVGPMYGKYNSCGDLIFSGHMCYASTALLLYLRTLDRKFPRFSRARWIAGFAYMMVLAILCISGRKHYTVDVVLGLMISPMVFFHFEHSWKPLCMQIPHAVAEAAYYSNASHFALVNSSRYKNVSTDDDEELVLAPMEARDNGLLVPSRKLEPVEFVC